MADWLERAEFQSFEWAWGEMRTAFIIANLRRLFLEVQLRERERHLARRAGCLETWLTDSLPSWLTVCVPPWLWMDSTDDDERARNKCVRVSVDRAFLCCRRCFCCCCCHRRRRHQRRGVGVAVQLNPNEEGFGSELNRETGRRVSPAGDSLASIPLPWQRLPEAEEEKQSLRASQQSFVLLRPRSSSPSQPSPCRSHFLLSSTLHLLQVALSRVGGLTFTSFATCNNRATNTSVQPHRANLNKNAEDSQTLEHSSLPRKEPRKLSRIMIYPTHSRWIQLSPFQWKRRG